LKSPRLDGGLYSLRVQRLEMMDAVSSTRRGEERERERISER